MTDKRRAAVIVGHEAVHVKLVDTLDHPHWLMPGQFDPGASREIGDVVRIELRGHSWHALKR